MIKYVLCRPIRGSGDYPSKFLASLDGGYTHDLSGALVFHSAALAITARDNTDFPKPRETYTVVAVESRVVFA